MNLKELEYLFMARLENAEILIEEDIHSAYMINIKHGDKILKVTYPYPVQEIYFDFYIGDLLIHNDWIDFYMNETEEYILDYIVNIAYKFLSLEIRYDTKILVFNNDIWEDIFQ